MPHLSEKKEEVSRFAIKLLVRANYKAQCRFSFRGLPRRRVHKVIPLLIMRIKAEAQISASKMPGNWLDMRQGIAT
jgi:hypothetical protein